MRATTRPYLHHAVVEEQAGRGRHQPAGYPAPREVWSGQLVRANVVPFAWTHTGKKGCQFGLNHLQIIQSEGAALRWQARRRVRRSTTAKSRKRKDRMMVNLDRPHPGELLSQAFELINARGDDYDNASDLEQNYREAAAVASVIIGKALARDIAMVMTCLKLVRSKSSPEKIDNYVDAMNYMAFSACFTGLVPLTLPVDQDEASNRDALRSGTEGRRRVIFST